VWDDTPLINADFSILYPAVTVKDINFLERKFLDLLEFKLAVSPSLYAQVSEADKRMSYMDVASSSHRLTSSRLVSLSSSCSVLLRVAQYLRGECAEFQAATQIHTEARRVAQSSE
jgi:hypothetical protein